ncbi:MAG: hypothetical protein RLZZ08_2073 [Pseudomonadota bacterium]|jgi:hypothetical protein
MMRSMIALPLTCLAMTSAVLLAGCSALPQSGKRGSGAPVRGRDAGQCLSALGRTGASFAALPDRYTGQGCSTLNTVQLSALHTDGAPLQIGNLGPVTCAVSQVFAGWAQFGADRAARQIMGSPLSRIETFGSYSCRNVAGTSRRSGHATAAAIDVSGFVLADGRRITVKGGWDGGSAAERQFLRTVQQSACKRFATVLGPQYNAAHADHLHLEGVLSGSGFCR